MHSDDILTSALCGSFFLPMHFSWLASLREWIRGSTGIYFLGFVIVVVVFANNDIVCSNLRGCRC